MRVNIEGQSAYTGMQVNIEGQAENANKKVTIEGEATYTSSKNTLNVRFNPIPGKGDLVNLKELGNTDILVLSMPTSESVYKRTEFVNDKSTGEGCAYCYTYMEKTLTFEDEEHGTYSLTFSSTESHFIINMDDFSRTFGKSRSDMNDISHAVEETWEYTERSFEQTTVSGRLSEMINEANGQASGTNIVFAAQSSAYKRTTASVTKGTVAYKDGSMGWYRENAMSNREIYNNCAVFLAEAFGDDSPIPVMGEKEFNELFAKAACNEKKPLDNANNADSADKTVAAKPKSTQEKREELLYSLNKFMERNLAAVRKKAPHSVGLKAFEKTYLEIGTYKYSEITSLLEKMFSSSAKNKSLQ
ncbi:MAG: hypothetical protein K2K57_08300 [Oscillospiraceae bacterium]|nr:hypothetical protein [Oscillospiraceae bacterium]